jgi:hypothetical protein
MSDPYDIRGNPETWADNTDSQSEKHHCACGSFLFYFKRNGGYWHCVKCDALYDQNGAEVTQ